MKKKKWFRRLAGLASAMILLPATTALAEETAQAATGDPASVYRAVGLGASAAFAIAISVLGAGYAVGRIGSAALGAAAEKPELLTRSILFVALAEGLAVLGFAVAMMLLQKI
jgi:V/A-type H+-transporting ATPase subunit K